MTAPADSVLEFVSEVRAHPFSEDWYEIVHRDHFWFQWRLRAALAQARDVGLPLRAPLRALEVGCGTGVLRDQLEGATDWVLDITDVHLDAVARAGRGRGRNLYYDVLERRPAFREAYDVVVLFDVLEHIEQRPPFLAAVVEHLRPGGHLLVNVPAMESLKSAYDTAAGHVLRYDKPTLRAELAGLPLQVLEARYWALSLVPLLALRKLLAGRTVSAATIRRGIRPPGNLAHAALRALMRLETALVRRAPIGASLLLAARKLAPR